jgi:hypothetical protein
VEPVASAVVVVSMHVFIITVCATVETHTRSFSSKQSVASSTMQQMYNALCSEQTEQEEA